MRVSLFLLLAVVISKFFSLGNNKYMGFLLIILHTLKLGH